MPDPKEPSLHSPESGKDTSEPTSSHSLGKEAVLSAHEIVGGFETLPEESPRLKLFYTVVDTLPALRRTLDIAPSGFTRGMYYRLDHDEASQAPTIELQVHQYVYNFSGGRSEIYDGRVTQRGFVLNDHPHFTTKHELGRPEGYDIFSVPDIMKDIFADTSDEEKKAIADYSVRKATSKDYGHFRDVIISIFSEHGPRDISILLDSIVTGIESDDETLQKGGSALKRTMNLQFQRAWRENKENTGELLEQLISRDLVVPEMLSNVVMMGDPQIADILVQYLPERDIFAGKEAHARRSMANMLFENALTKAIDNPAYNSDNAKILHKALFRPNDVKQELSVEDLLNLANSVTSRMNQNKPADKQQEPLPNLGKNSANFANAGEAIYRILALVAKSENQLVDSRNTVELFDALMKPYYDKLTAARKVTVADIAARYPDAKSDIILELKETASTEGYSAASQKYRQSGAHAYYNRHRPGYGTIS